MTAQIERIPEKEEVAMKKFSLFFMLVVAGIVSVLAGTPSFAATFNVTTSAELQLALTTAESNDEDDTINIAAGTYSTNGTTFTYAAASDETHSLTLKGAGAGSTILDGGYIVQVLQIVTPPSQDPSGASITIEDLTIQNGFTTGVAGGGLLLGNFYTSNVNAIIKNCTFSHNSAFSSDALGGGANLVFGKSNITITNTVFDHNSAFGSMTNPSSGTAQGGGAYLQCDGGNITITNTVFDHNFAFGSSGVIGNPAGGGVFVLGGQEIILVNNVFVSNAVSSSSTALGGGAELVAESTTSTSTTLTNNTFTLNSVTSANGTNGDGGGVVITSFGNTNIYNNIVYHNTGVGGIFVYDGQGSIGAPINLFNIGLTQKRP